MVYTFYRTHSLHFVRNERIGAGFHPALFFIKVAQVIVQEADLPDLVIHFTNAHPYRSNLAPTSPSETCHSLAATARSEARFAFFATAGDPAVSMKPDGP